MKKIALFIKSMRFHQVVVKNSFIFAPVIFSFHFFQKDYLGNSILAFLLFSLITGCIYIFNNCFDKKKDRLHPKKKKRPIASGKLGIPAAAVAASILTAAVLFFIFKFNRDFFIITIVYITLNILYSSYLKKIVILDVMVIAVGFVFRVKIGGAVTYIVISPWLLIITFLIAIFLGLIKRRQELLKVGSDNDKIKTRIALNQYNLPFLDQLISISTSTTLISYIIYVLNPDIQAKFHTKELYLTVPFVAFGIFRYLYLTYTRDKGESPAEIIFSDIPFTANLILWLIVFLFLIN